jgi:hypothetical protein
MGKEVQESRLTILKDEATKAGDFRLAIELAKIEDELDQKMAEARRQGLVIGFGGAIVCVVTGGVVTKVIVANKAK